MSVTMVRLASTPVWCEDCLDARLVAREAGRGVAPPEVAAVTREGRAVCGSHAGLYAELDELCAVVDATVWGERADVLEAEMTAREAAAAAAAAEIDAAWGVSS